MEKLSGILPNSPRVKSVDLSEAKPRRPGAPTFGVPQGTTSTKDRVTLSSTANIDEAAKDLLTYKNPKEARGAKIAEDISRKFFETRLLKQPMSAPRAEAPAPAEVSTELPEATPEMTDSVGTAPDSPLMSSYVPEKLEPSRAQLKQAVE